MSTEENLKAAFAGESQANRKYLAYAAKADEEGYPGVAKLFRAAAEAETIHALTHLKVMGVVKSTAENLQDAIKGETFEFTEMYPGFISEAEAADNAAAKRTFHLANEAEKAHADYYSQSLKDLDQKADADYY
ncbi:MAG TPA: rubrerythrin family protein, partial [Bacillota bacterium]|nr:rubrerythrin family protein [Bacillota bacterium]